MMKHKFFIPIALPAIALLGILFMTSGCMKVGPDYKPPKPEVPKAWQPRVDPAITPSKADIENWWEVFDDNTLNSLIKRAGEANLDLKAAVARIKEARAFIGVTSGEMYPNVTAEGSAVNQRSSENQAIAGTGATSTNLSSGFDASWEIDLFGRIARSIEAAKADYEASKEDYNDVMITLYADVANTYLSVRTYQSRIKAAVKNITSQKEVLRLTKSRFENGLATALDLSQAESVLASSQAELPLLRSALHTSVNTLAYLLGLPPGALHDELKVPHPIPVPPQEIAVGVPAELLRRRPDIRKAERQLAAQTARIGVATADLYPSFSILGTLGLAATDNGKFFNASSHYFSLGPSFKWNIFAGGAIRSQIQVEDARTEQALFNYEQTVLKALNEAENSFVDYLEQKKRVRALRDTVKSSQRTLDLAVRLFKEGLKDFQSVLDAQRSLFNDDNSLAQAEGESATYLVQVYKTLGGGWDPGKNQEPMAAKPAKASGEAKSKAP